jgi:hypothetical protein
MFGNRLGARLYFEQALEVIHHLCDHTLVPAPDRGGFVWGEYAKTLGFGEVVLVYPVPVFVSFDHHVQSVVRPKTGSSTTPPCSTGQGRDCTTGLLQLWHTAAKANQSRDSEHENTHFLT